ncbi:hypothetical protein FJ546_30380 [Mesorhizobium sp. B2-4-19]|uniref:hypothetical protein n=1 Tax=Mesorhizobium sp. B2-4-19 TaxID=2589930 RepID=UPI001129E81F|nr:hypothetical protein [Mesorhizobium sp. B2-4-19]TPK53364.1 hypothetical protein FJ546_30380 [Mesorhizobium sp. B2-4-19]
MFGDVSTTAALAADTTTVNWYNGTGKTINLSKNSCTPSGGCTFPTINTGQVKNTAASIDCIRSVIARYRYYDSTAGVYKSCQVSVSAYGPSSTWPGPGCEPGSFKATFIKSEGTGSSPTCSPGTITTDYASCTFTFNVNMYN